MMTWFVTSSRSCWTLSSKLPLKQLGKHPSACLRLTACAWANLQLFDSLVSVWHVMPAVMPTMNLWSPLCWKYVNFYLGLCKFAHSCLALLSATLSCIQLLLACTKLLISNVTAVFHNCTEAETEACTQAWRFAGACSAASCTADMVCVGCAADHG